MIDVMGEWSSLTVSVTPHITGLRPQLLLREQLLAILIDGVVNFLCQISTFASDHVHCEYLVTLCCTLTDVLAVHANFLKEA